MLIDADLIPIKEKADLGDAEAQLEIAGAFFLGRGVPKSIHRAKHYYELLAARPPDEVDFLGYGTLLALIGKLAARERKFGESRFWFEEAYKYITTTYVDDFAKEIMEEIDLEEYMKSVGCKPIDQIAAT